MQTDPRQENASKRESPDFGSIGTDRALVVNASFVA
jgi:hypothetical protein